MWFSWSVNNFFLIFFTFLRCIFIISFRSNVENSEEKAAKSKKVSSAFSAYFLLAYRMEYRIFLNCISTISFVLELPCSEFFQTFLRSVSRVMLATTDETRLLSSFIVRLLPRDWISVSRGDPLFARPDSRYRETGMPGQWNETVTPAPLARAPVPTCNNVAETIRIGHWQRVKVSPAHVAIPMCSLCAYAISRIAT